MSGWTRLVTRQSIVFRGERIDARSYSEVGSIVGLGLDELGAREAFARKIGLLEVDGIAWSVEGEPETWALPPSVDQWGRPYPRVHHGYRAEARFRLREPDDGIADWRDDESPAEAGRS